MENNSPVVQGSYANGYRWDAANGVWLTANDYAMRYPEKRSNKALLIVTGIISVTIILATAIAAGGGTSDTLATPVAPVAQAPVYTAPPAYTPPPQDYTNEAPESSTLQQDLLELVWNKQPVDSRASICAGWRNGQKEALLDAFMESVDSISRSDAEAFFDGKCF